MSFSVNTASMEIFTLFSDSMFLKIKDDGSNIIKQISTPQKDHTAILVKTLKKLTKNSDEDCKQIRGYNAASLASYPIMHQHVKALIMFIRR